MREKRPPLIKMPKHSKTTIESRWYDVFSSWKKADRDAALVALTQMNRVLPDLPKGAAPEAADLLSTQDSAK